MSRRKWTLLFRKEGRDKVHRYEALRKWELEKRIRQGWKVVERSK